MSFVDTLSVPDRRLDPLLTPSDVAQILRIKVSTVYAWSAHGRLPSVRVNGRVRFDSAVLQDFIRNGAKS